MSHVCWAEKHILRRIVGGLKCYPIHEQANSQWAEHILADNKESILRIMEMNIPEDQLKNCVSATLSQFLPITEKWDDINEFCSEDEEYYYENKLHNEAYFTIQVCIYEIMRHFNVPLIYENGSIYRGAVMKDGKWMKKDAGNARNEPSFEKNMPYIVKYRPNYKTRLIRGSLEELGVKMDILPHPRYLSEFNDPVIDMPYIVSCPLPREFIITINDVLINELHRLRITGYRDRFYWTCNLVSRLYGKGYKPKTVGFTREYIRRRMKLYIPEDVNVFDYIEKQIPWYYFLRTSRMRRCNDYESIDVECFHGKDHLNWASCHIFSTMWSSSVTFNYILSSEMRILLDKDRIKHAKENIERIMSSNVADNVLRDIVTRVIVRYQTRYKDCMADNDYKRLNLLSDMVYIIINTIMRELDIPPVQKYVQGQTYRSGNLVATMMDGYFYADTKYKPHNRLTHLGLPLVYADMSAMKEDPMELSYAVLITRPLKDDHRAEDSIIREMHEKKITKIRDRIQYAMERIPNPQFYMFTPEYLDVCLFGDISSEENTIPKILDSLDKLERTSWMSLYNCNIKWDKEYDKNYFLSGKFLT